jgi:hypothetical protein
MELKEEMKERKRPDNRDEEEKAGLKRKGKLIAN